MKIRTRVLPALMAVPFFVLVACSDPETEQVDRDAGTADQIDGQVDQPVGGIQGDTNPGLDAQDQPDNSMLMDEETTEEMAEEVDGKGPGERFGEKVDEVVEDAEEAARESVENAGEPHDSTEEDVPAN